MNGDHPPACPAYFTPMDVPKFSRPYCSCDIAEQAARAVIYSAPKKRPCCDWRDMPDEPVGSVFRCRHGQYWLAYTWDGCAPPSAVWRRVRWWDFKARRIIRSRHGIR